MDDNHPPSIIGHVASLHLHPPAAAGTPLENVEAFEVIAEKGIVGNGRYFSRISRSTGKPSRRQISLIEREQIATHASDLGRKSIPPGIVRANIETLGIKLVELVGHQVQIGEAILYFYEQRTPCSKMDAICAGLRKMMEAGRQGVLAEVVQSGCIRVGDSIQPLNR
ncbi:MAG: hypothetical protein JWQ71_961 [Pedosphaera sp.]|nr:hypothetical protein [Pedosphaera sp.]